MPVDEIVDPVGYSAWWTVLGLVLLLLAVAIPVVIVLLTRARAAETTRPAVPPQAGRFGGDPWAGLRAEFAARIDTVETRYRAGELDERGLHLALSTEVRAFASARTGQDASTMTLSEIQQLTRADELTQLIASYYRPSFADDDDPRARQTDPESSVARARTVVGHW